LRPPTAAAVLVLAVAAAAVAVAVAAVAVGRGSTTQSELALAVPAESQHRPGGAEYEGVRAAARGHQNRPPLQWHQRRLGSVPFVPEPEGAEEVAAPREQVTATGHGQAVRGPGRKVRDRHGRLDAAERERARAEHLLWVGVGEQVGRQVGLLCVRDAWCMLAGHSGPLTIHSWPSPSCPKWHFPQANTRPSSSRAQLWAAPQQTVFTRAPLSRGTGCRA
jgi:hypothetical protein